jgi:hypothetical protein
MVALVRPSEHQFKMRRIHATLDLASVMDNKAEGYITIDHFPSDDVSTAISPTIAGSG